MNCSLTEELQDSSNKTASIQSLIFVMRSQCGQKSPTLEKTLLEKAINRVELINFCYLLSMECC